MIKFTIYIPQQFRGEEKMFPSFNTVKLIGATEC